MNTRAYTRKPQLQDVFYPPPLVTLFFIVLVSITAFVLVNLTVAVLWGNFVSVSRDLQQGGAEEPGPTVRVPPRSVVVCLSRRHLSVLCRTRWPQLGTVTRLLRRRRLWLTLDEVLSSALRSPGSV